MTADKPPGLAPGDPWVDVIPFHFRTKLTDRESGLNYYGYRFYDPVDGRWLSRDPIGEYGGLNLYGMIGNDAVNRVDVLGREASRPPASVPGAIDGGFAFEWGEDNGFFKDMAGGGNGVGPYGAGFNGFYVSRNGAKVIRPDITLGEGARDIENLDEEIGEGEVKFCADCRISVHACSQSDAFAKRLAAVTGCRVVIAASLCSPTGGLDPGRSWRSAEPGFGEFDPDGTIKKLGRTYDPNFNFKPSTL